MADSIRERIIQDAVTRAGLIKRHEVVTGLTVTPGDVDEVSVSGGTCYLTGVLTTVLANTALSIPRSTDPAKPKRWVSVIVTSLGAVAAVSGTVGSTLLDTRGTAAGEMPAIPSGAIELKMVRHLTDTSGIISSANIVSIAGDTSYKTNIGFNAVRAVKTHDEDTSGLVVVIPRQETSEKTRFGKMSHTMPLEVLGSILFDPTVITISKQSEDIYADLVKAFTNPESPFSTLIDEITHTGGGGMEVPSNEEQYAGAIAKFEVKYKTVLGNPETQ